MENSGLRRLVPIFALLLAACGVSSSPPASGPPAEGEVLSVLRTEPELRAPIARDRTLRVRFSEPLDPSSIRSGSVRVVRRGGQEQPVDLRIEEDTLLVEPPRPYGFAADAEYALIVEGFPSLLAPRSRSGRPLGRRHRAEFRASHYYDSDLEPPGVRSIDLADDARGGFSLHVRFTETIDPDSLVPGTSLIVRDADSGRALDGRIIADRLGAWYRFLPGEGERPGRVHVVLTEGVTDLVGNPLSPYAGELEATFELPETPDPSPTGEIAEDFDDSTMLDPAETTALWNGDRSPGVLLAEPVATPLAIEGDPAEPTTLLDIGARETALRVLVGREELGLPREITGLEWSPAGGTFVPAEYEYLEVTITPTTRERLDGEGFELDRPTVVFRRAPWRIEEGEWERTRIPFSPSFAHDGESSLLVEIRIGRGDHTNFLLARHEAGGRAEVRRDGDVTAVRPSLTLRSFSWAPVATSRFYDTGVADPVYLPPIVQPERLPAGVKMRLLFQGARRLGPDGRPPADDPAATSPLTADVTELAGWRWLRFRIEFEGVSLSGGEAAVDDLIVPFRRAR